MKRLNENSEVYKRLVEIEELMSKDGIKIYIKAYSDLILEINGRDYKIGRYSDQFPRFVDEPFILME